MDKLLSQFKHARILVIGDVMIDEYVWGDVNRISPEAPVQIVQVHHTNITLGGAGNVVNNLRSFDAEVYIASVVGDGIKADQLIRLFQEKNANIDGIIRDPNRPTIVKTRIMASGQHVLRIDYEKTHHITQSQEEQIAHFAERTMPKIDLLIISDYGKGLLTNSLLQQVIALAQKHQKPIIVDPKGKDYIKYKGASIITPNLKEISLATGIEINELSSIQKAGRLLIDQVGLERLLITCGKDGMVLFEPDREPYHIQTQARQVFDVSGAGDTVVSVMALALATGNNYLNAAQIANTAAGIVVAKVGTATVSPNELKTALDPSKKLLPNKFRSGHDLDELIQSLKNQRKKIVLTNGCFDLLHAGHIEFLAASKKCGDVLIVALDSDASVKKIKGPKRPVINEEERIRIISALSSVDYITVFSTEELNALLEKIKPNVLTKGSNYSTEKVYGNEIIKKYGGTVELIPVVDYISSSQIIQKIIQNEQNKDVT